MTKLKEIIDSNTRECTAISEEQKEKLLSSFVQIREPEPEERTFGLIVLSDHKMGGGASCKPGNIVLNWRRLFNSFPGLAAGIVGAGNSTCLLALAALGIWMELYSAAKITLDTNQAVAMKAMWDNVGGRQRISEDLAFKKTNEMLKDFGFPPIENVAFANVINSLERIGCLEITDGDIWLREWIKRAWP
jgi:hypothetical protein